MAKTSGRRKFLNIVILISSLGIVVTMGPTILDRATGLFGFTPAESPENSWANVGDDLDRIQAELEAENSGETSSALTADDVDRRMQQLQVHAGELIARERAISAREEVIRREVLAEFWKRQGAAAGFTVALATLIVLFLARRIADWTGFTKRLREEEARLRNLQLSVIGALEEFESELAAARAWAAAEARARRPGTAEQDFFPQHAGTEAMPAAEMEAERSFFDDRVRDGLMSMPTPVTRPVEAETPAEEELPTPPGLEELGRREMGAAEAQAPRQASPFSADVPQRTARPIQPERPADPFDEAWPPGSPGAREASGGEAPPTWAERFVEPAGEPPRAEHWADPVRRSEPISPPAHISETTRGGPGTREQVEYLAAEGLSENEIARRLGLSREEIHLVLTLRRRSQRDPGSPPGHMAAHSAPAGYPEWGHPQGPQRTGTHG